MHKSKQEYLKFLCQWSGIFTHHCTINLFIPCESKYHWQEAHNAYKVALMNQTKVLWNFVNHPKLGLKHCFSECIIFIWLISWQDTNIWTLTSEFCLYVLKSVTSKIWSDQFDPTSIKCYLNAHFCNNPVICDIGLTHLNSYMRCMATLVMLSNIQAEWGSHPRSPISLELKSVGIPNW